MIPTRYLIATLFIAALLLLVAVVQAPRSPKSGGVAAAPGGGSALTLESFEVVAEARLEEGWAPRFRGTRDPDQPDPWPFEGGFGAPWEPASPYLWDQGLALNGPRDRSEVILWRGLEWRHYRFDVPLVSARIHPRRLNRLLVTLQAGPLRFETRLLEIPEGRVLWSVDSGPWSRFSWDGATVLIGLQDPQDPERLLLSSLPLEGEPPSNSLSPWDEKSLPPPPRGWPLLPDALWDDGKDLPGARILTPFSMEDRMWMPTRDRLWIQTSPGWTLWGLEGSHWRRQAAGPGLLAAQPPRRMGLVRSGPSGDPERATSPLEQARWTTLPPGAPSWPAYDPSWVWRDDRSACTAWDLRWAEGSPVLPREQQREALLKRFRGDWRAARGLRASVKGWLPAGPELALREGAGAAWVWVGDRVVLVKLPEGERLRQIRKILGLR
ncbi:MAG: hypothetical protein HY823_08665 [Acidobacteria bacterium]|nr:hypothetical protein [Acidobacteriota bacterium]